MGTMDFSTERDESPVSPRKRVPRTRRVIVALVLVVIFGAYEIGTNFGMRSRPTAQAIEKCATCVESKKSTSVESTAETAISSPAINPTQIKRAIVYLLTHISGEDGKRMAQINKSLNELVQNYLNVYNLRTSTKIVIYHDDTLNPKDLKGLQGIWKNGTTEMVYLNLTNHPDFKPPSWKWKDPLGSRYMECAGRIWKPNYIYMNVHRIRSMWNHPSLDGIESVVNLDTDLYFPKKAKFDYFQKFEDNDLVYAYHECTREKATDCLDGLPEAIGKYIKRHNLTTNHLGAITWNTAYAGNFAMFKLSFFRSAQYQSLAEYLVTEEQGVYRTRWADQNIWAIALGLFVNRGRIANWYELFDGQYLVHKSESLGGLKGTKNKVNLKDGPMCKHNFGCACRSGAKEEKAKTLQKFGLPYPKKAYVTMIANDDFVAGALVLLHSLRRTNSINDKVDFVVMQTGNLTNATIEKLEVAGVRVIKQNELEVLDRSASAQFKDRYKDRSWMMFMKLNVFNLVDYSRVVYLDADIIALRDISFLMDQEKTPALTAAPEKKGLAPEFNAGLLVIDPSHDVFEDMKGHINDKDYLCGFRATDQSFLCHYFHPTHTTWKGGAWKSLPSSFMALHKVTKSAPDKTLASASVLHFNGPKPWLDGKGETNDKLMTRWHSESLHCGNGCIMK